jgi:glycogen operon protein
VENADRVIYELCVRGFTAHPSAGVAAPGTFAGLIEKVPYLSELGITTVELLPIAEWDENEVRHRSPLTGEPLRNLWGYNPITFSAPKAGLAADRGPGGALGELRRLVEALHAAGIEVVLDVVYNHTSEGDGMPGGPVHSFRGIEDAVYYLYDPESGDYLDATGCGNTVACNHPVVANLIVDSLRFWAAEVGADGFRFDLASVLTRGAGGVPLAQPPVLERIAEDPLLADRVLIAEPWDAGGLYQLGLFARQRTSESAGRWAEWNDRFRDDVRRFVRGEPGMAGALAARLAGSRDVFHDSPLGPLASINFVTCHDGFTLADLVSYDHKHNEGNGEGNRDGTAANHSWNCGVEGPTDDPAVLALRRRQARNLLTLLLVAQGVPMLLAGDELGRTQRGNNNAWCQDNEVGWVDWAPAAADAGLLRFTRGLLAFRRAHPGLRRHTFLSGVPAGPAGRPDVAWHGTRLGHPDWGPRSRCLAMHLAGEHAPAPDCDLFLAANASDGDLSFELPAPARGERWVRVVATWEEPPRDLLAPGEEEPVPGGVALGVPPHAIALLRSAAG